jgi:sporulation protein YlmC with PRC-barrel domain
MRISRLSKELFGFQIINIENGQIIGKVEDIFIDLKMKRIAALVISKSNPLSRDLKTISSEKVTLWGEDVILISGDELIEDSARMDESAQWELVSNEINGKNVISNNGEKIAELNDVLINADGELIGYDFSKVMIEGPLEKSKRAHVKTTQSLGPDALILQTNQLYEWKMDQ